MAWETGLEFMSMQNYIAKVRANPRRKAAMDRASARIAVQLEAKMGETIVSLRSRHGLTQQELAEKSQLKQSYLSRIENHKCSLHNTTVSKIASALGCTDEKICMAFSNQWKYLENKKA
ncbi:putative transcriptional repressor [Vitreoscilla sp. C1]|uniref:helix-turn-helix domain-containing protein n=1 Tax=Vitreoscilla sp. (strain C1) TaxID=96942 RepID=UPI000CDCC134|nr:helix-turn-helix transcriptional regulator [Vitreoscilla sp. C1]AUZ05319.1 putative transcriptional repressor [Vitreoscilla sp. C1]